MFVSATKSSESKICEQNTRWSAYLTRIKPAPSFLVAVDEDVFKLDVSVDDVVIMEVGHSLEKLPGYGSDTDFVKPRILAPFGHQIAMKVARSYKFHHKVVVGPIVQ